MKRNKFFLSPGVAAAVPFVKAVYLAMRTYLRNTIVCGLLALPLLVHGADFESADEYYEDALRLFKQKDFATSIIQLKNALQLNDKHLPAKILLGQAYLGSGEAQAAEVQLRRARRQGADENLVAVPIANTLLSQEKYRDLEDYIARTRRAPDVDSRLQVILGIALVQQSQYGKANQRNTLARSPRLIARMR